MDRDGSLREQVAELVGAQLDEYKKQVVKRLDEIDDGLHTNNRLRNLALATAIICMVAAGFSAGYALTSREQLQDAKIALTQQIETNRLVVCSSARSTALAFREPQVSADGTAEPRGHFINRMLAQRVTLKLAGPLRCAELPGFATFPFLRAKALYEIEKVLHEANPKRFAEPKGVSPVNGIPRAAHEELANPPPTGAVDSPSSTSTEPTATAPTHEEARSPPKSGGNHSGHEHTHSGGQESSHEGQESAPGGSEGGSSGGSPPVEKPTEVATGSEGEDEEPTVAPPPKKVAGIELLPEGGGVAKVEVEAVEGVGACLPGVMEVNCGK